MAGGGNGSPSAAGAGGRAARSRSQGHLTRWEPRPEARGDPRGTGARAGQGPTAPRGSGRGRLRAAAALGAHRLRSSALLTGLPPLPGLARSRDTDSGRSPEEAGPPSPQSGTASSQSFVSPPLLSAKRRSHLLSSPLKPTWRLQLPERESGTPGLAPHQRPPPPFPSRTQSASLRRPPWSITGSVVHAPSPDFEATPLLVTVARKGKLAFAKLCGPEVRCNLENYLGGGGK